MLDDGPGSFAEINSHITCGADFMVSELNSDVKNLGFFFAEFLKNGSKTLCVGPENPCLFPKYPRSLFWFLLLSARFAAIAVKKNWFNFKHKLRCNFFVYFFTYHRRFQIKLQCSQPTSRNFEKILETLPRLALWFKTIFTNASAIA